jgi:hypothetical protein
MNESEGGAPAEATFEAPTPPPVETANGGVEGSESPTLNAPVSLQLDAQPESLDTTGQPAAAELLPADDQANNSEAQEALRIYHENVKTELLGQVDGLSDDQRAELQKKELKEVQSLIQAIQAHGVLYQEAIKSTNLELDSTEQALVEDVLGDALVVEAVEAGKTPEAAQGQLENVKQELDEKLNELSDSSLMILIKAIEAANHGSSFSRLIDAFLGRSLESYGVGGEYPWGKEEASIEMIGREEFVQQLDHPQELAKKIIDAYHLRDETNQHKLLEVMPLEGDKKAAKELLEKASTDGDPEALRQVLYVFGDYFFNAISEEKQKEAWETFSTNLGQTIDSGKSQPRKLSGKVWVLFRDEYARGEKEAFNKFLKAPQAKSEATSPPPPTTSEAPSATPAAAETTYSSEG